MKLSATLAQHERSLFQISIEVKKNRFHIDNYYMDTLQPYFDSTALWLHSPKMTILQNQSSAKYIKINTWIEKCLSVLVLRD